MPHNQEQKASIILAATSLFARFGLEKTTMEDIAKAAKKAKSSLYYYFESKEQVFAEVIRYEIAGLKAAIVEAIEKEIEPRNKLRKFVNTRLNYLNDKADQYIAIKEEYLKHYAFIENLTMDYSNWEISTIKSILEYGQAKGIFDVTNLETNSKAIFLALKGLEYPWTLNLARQEISKSVDVLIDILLKGINKS
jgi:AcrR family transcriptional regulator